MQVHQIKFKLKKSKRVGRGGKKGNYSGKGMKGQKSRAGHRIRPALRDVILKLPKKRGFKNIKIQKKIFETNLKLINEKFKNNEVVNFKTLQKKKIIKIPKSVKNFKIKILGQGDLNKSLIFDRNLIFSKSAFEKLEKSGSKIQ
jgi:large subunit ribosomal protein L15